MTEKPTYEELEQRVNNFENEAEKRKQAKEALRKAHDELELRVEERTIELKQANEQIEIAERKRTEELILIEKNLSESIMSSLP